MNSCRLCGSKNIEIEYDGIIRDGSVDVKTKEKVKMYHCKDCGAIWHDNMKEYGAYYVSEDYRKELEHTASVSDFYQNHDFECKDKFDYTGIDIYRNKVVTDIGCGGGGFLDFLSGVAKEIVAIEPSKRYREDMQKRGYHTYAYTSEALQDYQNKIDVAVSFDVIEHVEEPVTFLKDIYQLLAKGGKAIVGTPTDAPVMRELLGEVYEENLLFSTQHIWVLNESSLAYAAKKAGFDSCQFKYKQRYGLGNMISWLIHKKVVSGKKEYSFLNSTLDEVWKRQLEEQKKSDYILLYLEK